MKRTRGNVTVGINTEATAFVPMAYVRIKESNGDTDTLVITLEELDDLSIILSGRKCDLK